MRKLLIPLALILFMAMGCQKDHPIGKKYTICHTDPKTGKQETLEVEANSLRTHYGHGDVEGECPHVNSLSYTLESMNVIAETFAVERSVTNANLISIRAIQYLDGGAGPTPVTLILNIDGYNGVVGNYTFGSPAGWGNNNISTTTASFSIPTGIYPPSREGTFEITEIKKRSDGEVITGTFAIIFGANGFNDRHLTDGHFSLLVPKI